MKPKDPTLSHSYLRNTIPDPGHMRLTPVESDSDLVAAIVSELMPSNAAYRLKPDRLLSIISDADAGDPREQAALFATVQEKEPIFAAHLQTRRLAVLSCRWQVQSERHPKEAEEIAAMLKRANIRRALSHLLDAIGTGYSGVAVDWAPGGGEIRGFTPIMPDCWTFDRGGFPALNTVAGGEIPLASYNPHQVIYIQADGKAGLPSRKGVMRTLLWLFLFKNAAFRNWEQFLEKFGVPFILGKIPSSDFNNADLRDKLKRQLMAIRSGGAGVGTTETDMQILNGASSGNQNAFELFQRYCDEVAALTVLGQLATSDRSSGLSNGGAQAQVRQDLLQADCLMLQEKINSVLIDGICRFRYGMPDADGLEFVIECEPAEDLKQLAERDARVAQATGCRLSREYAMKKYGLELEEFQPAQPAKPPMAPGEFSDAPQRRRSPVDAILQATLARLVDEDAFAAWRGPIDQAIKKAFGDLDPADPDLIDRFRERAPAFQASLPGLMDTLTADDFEKALSGAMLAAFLNGALPPDFWKTGEPAK